MTPLTGSKHVLHPLKTVTGFTLMEIAVLMMVMAIGLCPLLASSGGLSGLANGAATASGANKGTSQAQIMAYSVMQQALTGQIPTGNQMAGTLDVISNTNLPQGGVYTGSLFAYDATGRFRYNWELRDYSYPYFRKANLAPIPNMGTFNAATPSEMALGNRLVMGKVNLYDSQISLVRPVESYTSLITVSNPAVAAPSDTAEDVSLDILVDFSSSMTNPPARAGMPNYCPSVSVGPYANFEVLPPDTSGAATNPGQVCFGQRLYQNLYFGLPFLTDRYFRTDSPPPGVKLDILNDSQLDIVGFRSTDDPATPYPDHYPSNGSLGMPNCTQMAADSAAFRAFNAGSLLKDYFMIDLPAPYELVHFYGSLDDEALPSGATHFRTNSFGMFDWFLQQYCERATSVTTLYQPVYGADANRRFSLENFSKIEQFRSVLLMLLVAIEKDPVLSSKLKIGLTTFGSNPTNQLAISAVQNTHPVTSVPLIDPLTSNPRSYFYDLREKLLWINRLDRTPTGGLPTGTMRSITPRAGDAGTVVWRGLNTSTAKLTAEPNTRTKMMLFFSDGMPTNFGSTFTSAPPTLFDLVNTNLVPNNITLHTVGWYVRNVDLGAGGNTGGNILPNNLKTMAEQTDHGQFFEVDENTIHNIVPLLLAAIQPTTSNNKLLNELRRQGLEATCSGTCQTLLPPTP